MEKGKALDAALSQIERAFGKGSIMRMGAKQQSENEIETISTGSLGLDIALGIGGLPTEREAIAVQAVPFCTVKVHRASIASVPTQAECRAQTLPALCPYR